MIVAGCETKDCVEIATHKLSDKGLCCRCFEKALSDKLREAIDMTHNYLNLGNEISDILEGF